MGMSLPYSSTAANEDGEALENAQKAAQVLVEAVHAGGRCPRDIITRESIEMQCQSSWRWVVRQTRCCIFLRLRHSAEVPWNIDDFERIRQRVPVICDLKPSGKYLTVDLHQAVAFRKS